MNPENDQTLRSCPVCQLWKLRDGARLVSDRDLRRDTMHHPRCVMRGEQR